MKNKPRFLFFSLAGILAAFILTAANKPGYGLSRTRFDASQQNHLIEGSTQASPCMALLLEAASRAGVTGTIQNSDDTNYGDACYVQYIVSSENGSDATKTAFGLVSSQLTIEKSCEYASQEQFTITTFHGYNARTYYQKGETRMVNDVPYTYERKDLNWCMYKGGRSHYLSVMTDTQSIEKYGTAQDPLLIADVLWLVAEDRLPLSEEAAQPSQPFEPGEVVPNQPQEPADSGGISEVPLGIILGSLGIPILGALTGTVLSTLLSSLPSAGVTNTGASLSSIIADVPETAETNDQGLYWSERPWDEAGPGYVSKDEYERTKDMLAQGYKWKNSGWQIPDEIRQSDQWQQNNRDGVAREDEQFLKELEQNQQREFPQKDLRTFDMRLGDFKEDLYALQDELEKTNYVLNPYQGDPTILIHRAICLKNMAYDATIGQFTGQQGLTCEGFVQNTSNKANAYLQKHFPGATVESVVFEERSSQADAKGLMNWFDSRIDDNHNLLRVKLPDGSLLAVDFHQSRAGKAPLIRKWDEARKVWSDYMGESELIERTSYTLGGN